MKEQLARWLYNYKYHTPLAWEHMSDSARQPFLEDAQFLLIELQHTIDRSAVAWLVDCIIADNRNDKCTRFTDYLQGKETKDLTMERLLRLNPATSVIHELLKFNAETGRTT